MRDSPEGGAAPTRVGLPAELGRRWAAAGLNVAGVLAIPAYDRLVPAVCRAERLLPGARTALMLAAGGRGYEQAVAARRSDGLHPYDDHTCRVVEDGVREIEAAGVPARALYAWQCFSGGDPLDGRGQRIEGAVYPDWIALAREAGLGAPGRLRLLLHPEFGAWLSLRAVVLLQLDLEPTRRGAAGDPCRDCSACVDACPGYAFPDGQLDIGRCATVRRAGGDCRLRCAARRACVVAPQHAYSLETEAHYMRTSLAALESRPEAPVGAGAPDDPAGGPPGS